MSLSSLPIPASASAPVVTPSETTATSVSDQDSTYTDTPAASIIPVKARSDVASKAELAAPADIINGLDPIGNGQILPLLGGEILHVLGVELAGSSRHPPAIDPAISNGLVTLATLLAQANLGIRASQLVDVENHRFTILWKAQAVVPFFTTAEWTKILGSIYQALLTNSNPVQCIVKATLEVGTTSVALQFLSITS
jgi:hypothetical protein